MDLQKYYWDQSLYKKSTSARFYYTKNFFTNPLILNDFFVLQIGIYHGKTNTLIDTHIHKNFFELTIITEGEGTITTNGYPVKVKKGDIYLSLPFDSHKIESDENNILNYYFLSFATENDVFSKELDNISMNHNSPNSRVINDERIPWLVGTVIPELDGKNNYFEMLLSSIFTQIMIYLIYDFKKTKPKKLNIKTSHSEQLCYNVMNYIDTHIFSIKNLDELTNVTSYSYGYLSSIFKKTTSQSINSYFQKRKMQIAQILLLENELNITQIAEKLNYSSIYAFSKAFTDFFELSPSEYRSQMLNSKDESFDIASITMVNKP